MESAKKSDESDASFPSQNKEKPTELVNETVSFLPTSPPVFRFSPLSFV